MRSKRFIFTGFALTFEFYEVKRKIAKIVSALNFSFDKFFSVHVKSTRSKRFSFTGFALTFEFYKAKRKVAKIASALNFSFDKFFQFT